MKIWDKCYHCDGKGKVLIVVCPKDKEEHEWKVKEDWSLTLGKQLIECTKCKETKVI